MFDLQQTYLQLSYLTYNLQFKHLADALNPERLTILSIGCHLEPIFIVSLSHLELNNSQPGMCFHYFRKHFQNYHYFYNYNDDANLRELAIQSNFI